MFVKPLSYSILALTNTIFASKSIPLCFDKDDDMAARIQAKEIPVWRSEQDYTRYRGTH